jgi:hypothetical protein
MLREIDPGRIQSAARHRRRGTDGALIPASRVPACRTPAGRSQRVGPPARPLPRARSPLAPVALCGQGDDGKESGQIRCESGRSTRAPAERTFGAIDYGALEAGVMVMAVPCVALFLALQRHYVRGFTTGALRG